MFRFLSRCSTPCALAFGPIAATIALLACSQLTATAQKIEPTLAAACTDAKAIATVAGLVPGVGAITAYITAGCDTAEGLAKLAADPTSAAWLGGLSQQVKDLAAKVGVKIA